MMLNEEVLMLTDALCSAPAETDAALWEDKLIRLLDCAVRTIDCELSVVQKRDTSDAYPLLRGGEFPLPDALAPAAAYLAAYLASGNGACKSGYERALESYLLTLEVTVAPIGDRYRF